MELKDIRVKIDDIDAKLVPLLKERFDCSLAVAEYKKANNLPILNTEREEQIIESVMKAGGEHGSYIAAVYREIMGTSRELQQNEMVSHHDLAGTIVHAKSDLKSDTVIACQGTQGAFSHMAASNLFPKGDIRFYGNFADVFRAVENGEATYGVVPVENSNAGSVQEVYDLILKYRHYIVAAAALKVNENLLGVKGSSIEDIKTVYSHPQALNQSDKFIKEHGFTPVQYSNTALAAKMVAEKGDKTVGAIASVQAAQSFGLEVLAHDIQTVKANSTRFITISKELIIPDDSNKVSVVFTLPHVTGSLYRILNRFALKGLNLTKIESRTARNGRFEYEFYLDFSGNMNDRQTISLVSTLQAELPDFTFLGNYKEIELNNH